MNLPLSRWRAGDYRGWADARLDRAALLPVARVLEMRFDGAVPWRTAPDREIHRLPPPEAASHGFFVKRYELDGWWAVLRSAIGSHKSSRAWKHALALLPRGVPIPAPVAYLRRFAGPLLRPHCEHVLVMRDVAASASLAERLAAWRREPLERRRALLRELAIFLAGLHREGVYHGDLTARNLLVREPPPRILLVDLDAVRSVGWIPRRRRLKNLDELGRNVLDLGLVSTADRARFLRDYLAADPGGGWDFAGLFRTVHRRTLRRLAREGRGFARVPGARA